MPLFLTVVAFLFGSFSFQKEKEQKKRKRNPAPMAEEHKEVLRKY